VKVEEKTKKQMAKKLKPGHEDKWQKFGGSARLNQEKK